MRVKSPFWTDDRQYGTFEEPVLPPGLWTRFPIDCRQRLPERCRATLPQRFPTGFRGACPTRLPNRFSQRCRERSDRSQGEPLDSIPSRLPPTLARTVPQHRLNAFRPASGKLSDSTPESILATLLGTFRPVSGGASGFDSQSIAANVCANGCRNIASTFPTGFRGACPTRLPNRFPQRCRERSDRSHGEPLDSIPNRLPPTLPERCRNIASTFPTGFRGACPTRLPNRFPQRCRERSDRSHGEPLDSIPNRLPPTLPERCRAHGRLPTTIHTRKITREHILGFHAWLRKHGNSERTIADKHQRVKAWLRFCKIDTSFMPPVPKYERKKVTVYTPSEIGAVRAAADPYMRMVIDLALKLGLREREISHAEWGDLDKHHGTFRVQAKVREDWRFSPKDSEQRDIPVPTDLLKSLKQWHEAHPETVLIVGNDEDKPEGHLLRKLKTLVRNAGLNCGKCEGCLREGSSAECERWFLHRFRSTYLTKIVRKMDLESARKFAGHSDIQTTQIYLEAADAASPETRKAINAIRWE
jgi:integrase